MDPESQRIYPELPNCTMSPQNWNIPDWGPAVGPVPSPPGPPVPRASFVGCYWDKGYPNHYPAPCDLPVVKQGTCPKGPVLDPNDLYVHFSGDEDALRPGADLMSLALWDVQGCDKLFDAVRGKSLRVRRRAGDQLGLPRNQLHRRSYGLVMPTAAGVSQARPARPRAISNSVA